MPSNVAKNSDRQVARRGTFQDFVDVPARATEQIGEIYSIGQEAASVRVLAPAGHGRQSPLRCERTDLAAIEIEQVIAQHKDCARSSGHGGVESLRELSDVGDRQDLNRNTG